jgi:hypothetical protein
MNTALDQSNFTEPTLTRALILEYDEAEGCYWLLNDNSRLGATLAVSCLLRPEKGDTILFFEDTSGRAYILAVLERASGFQAKLDLPAESIIRAESLSLEAGAMNLSGGLLNLNFTVLNFMARQMTSAIRNIVQRCRNISVEARETSRLSAGRLRLSAREGLSARAEDVDIKAESAVKVNGRSIQLG